MNKNSSLKILQKISFILGFFIAIIGFIFKEIAFIYISALFFVSSNVFFTFQRIYERILFFVFQLTFTLFLLIKPIILILEGNIFIKFGESITWDSAIIVLISIFTMSFIVLLPFKLIVKKRNLSSDYSEKNYYVRKIAKILYYVTYCTLIGIIIEKIIYTQSHTIYEYYDSFSSIMPSIITKLADSNMIIFYVFLATFPSKKEAKLIIFLHIFASILTLGYGVRNIIVLNFLALLLYIVIRDENASSLSNRWLKMKIILKILLCSPIAIVGLQAFDNIRRGISSPSIDLFRNFLFSQGGSSEVISLSIFYAKEIPNQIIPYSFGSIFNYITQNSITRFIFGNTYYAQNTIEMAVYGHHLGSTLAFLDYPVTYLAGVGMGSSFLAELYIDFSYLGVVMGTILITLVLLNLVRVTLKNPYLLGIGLVMIRWIIYMPRDTYTNWFVQGFSLMNIFIVIFILFLSTTFKERNKINKKGLL